ncbi:right-handed parallel beta-helix repeat-containing protein [bacterium]|nr:right-handed parallel beta-helix repeat-containing protein [bacterium]
MKKLIITINLFLFVTVFLLLIETQITHAQTYIMGGDVRGTWTLSNSPYHINGEIIIPNGETLTIEPGVDVIFTGHYKFNVQGRLLAIGTEENTITLTPQDTTIGWHGIRFSRTLATNDSSKIIYCNLQYGKAIGSSTDDKRGGAIFVRSFSKVLISHCLITNNKTHGDKLTGGAGIFLDSCSAKIVNNSISSNKAMGGHGGGIFVINSSSNPLIINNIIFNNRAFGGGGIACYLCNPILINNTITNNGLCDHGGGIDCIRCSPTLINTILYGNTAGIGKQVHVGSPAEPNFYFCDIEGGKNAFARDHKPGGSFSGGYEKNIDSKPLFVDVVNGDYHLSDFSLCIGAGVDTIEIDGIWHTAPLYDYEGNPKPLPAGSNQDVGAFENILESPTTGID